MSNLCSAETVANAWWKHSGFTTTILASATSPHGAGFGDPYGIAFDGTNLYSTDHYAQYLFRLSGWTSTYSGLYQSVGTAQGIDLDGSGNTIHTTGSSGGTTNKVIKYSGFSSTISASFNHPGSDCHGCNWDGYGVNIQDGNRTVWRQAGFSSTTNATFTSATTFPRGVCYGKATGNSATDSEVSNKIYQHSGFTTTVASSIASPANSPRGLDWYDPATKVPIFYHHYQQMMRQ